MVSHNPAERSLIAGIAADTRWAYTNDRAAATLPARQALTSKYEREVDPEGRLTPAERARRAESAQRAHMRRMALKSAQARRLRARADQLESELDAVGGVT